MEASFLKQQADLCHQLSATEARAIWLLLRRNGQVWLLLLLTVLPLLTGCTLPRREPPEAKGGVLDLRSWDFDRDGSLELRGEWLFYWKQQVPPSTVLEPSPGQRVMVLPGSWDLQQPESARVPAQGYGTFQLKVLLPSGLLEGRTAPPVLALRSRDQSTAYTLWVNQHPLLEAGTRGIAKSKR